MSKLVGLYTGADIVLEHPDYFDILKQEIGLTHVHIGGHYVLSEATLAKNPMPPGSEQYAPSMGGDDNTPLRRAIDAAHDKGLQVWLGGGGWHGGAERFPEMCARDLHDRAP